MRKKNAAALIAATNNDGIWQSDAVNGLGALRVLIREGQPLNGKTVTSFNVLKASIGSVGVPRSFNNRSTITALVTYTDGGTAIVVIAFPSLFDSVGGPLEWSWTIGAGSRNHVLGCVGVDIERGVWVAAENSRGTRGGDFVADGGADGGGFARAGNGADEFACAHECRNGKGDCVSRHGLKRGEAAIVDLLLAAFGVEFHSFYERGVGEVRDGRIVEGEVSVFTDSEAANIEGCFVQ